MILINKNISNKIYLERLLFDENNNTKQLTVF